MVIALMSPEEEVNADLIGENGLGNEFIELGVGA